MIWRHGVSTRWFECNNVYSLTRMALCLHNKMSQTWLTCTLVPTKNKSLVLCQPIVLAPVFARTRQPQLWPEQKLCFILQQFYTGRSAFTATVLLHHPNIHRKWNIIQLHSVCCVIAFEIKNLLRKYNCLQLNQSKHINITFNPKTFLRKFSKNIERLSI